MKAHNDLDLDQRGKNLNGTQIDLKLLLAWMAIPHYLTEYRLDHKPDWPQNNFMKCTFSQHVDQIQIITII